MPEDGVMVIRKAHETSWVEVRGEYEGPDPAHDPFQQALDGLTASHASGLFNGGGSAVYPGCGDFEHVERLWESD